MLPKGYKHSEEAKRKISKAMMGNKRTSGHRLSKEHKAKIGQSRKGSKHPLWKGGKTKAGEGRILIMAAEHPFARSGGYVFRSRLVMEKALGRYLKPCEIVHHINGIVDDDRPENLRLFATNGSHTSFHNSTRN